MESMALIENCMERKPYSYSNRINIENPKCSKKVFCRDSIKVFYRDSIKCSTGTL